MRKWAKFIPEGMNDYIFEDVKRKRFIEKAITEVFEGRGYLEIATPTLEFFDVFNTAENNVPFEDMYKLFDAKGRILTLRHDMTTPISRVAATKLKNEATPIKLCYNQNVYRSNDYLNGRRDEITQCGVEIIGLSNYKADVEVLITAIEALKSATSHGFKIELGHIEFFKAIANELKEEPCVIEEIRDSIEKKNFAKLDSIIAGLDPANKGVAAMGKLPRLFGGTEIIDSAVELAPNKQAIKILEDLKKIINELNDLGYGEYVAVDLGMVHHIGYYTGLIFRGYLDGSGENCLAGGRYDTLSQNFGGELPSTGFAITVDSILETQERTATEISVTIAPQNVIFYEEGCIKNAYKIYHSVRVSDGVSIISLHETFEEGLKHAKSLGATTFYHVKKDKTEIINLI